MKVLPGHGCTLGHTNTVYGPIACRLRALKVISLLPHPFAIDTDMAVAKAAVPPMKKSCDDNVSVAVATTVPSGSSVAYTKEAASDSDDSTKRHGSDHSRFQRLPLVKVPHKRMPQPWDQEEKAVEIQEL